MHVIGSFFLVSHIFITAPTPGPLSPFWETSGHGPTPQLHCYRRRGRQGARRAFQGSNFSDTSLRVHQHGVWDRHVTNNRRLSHYPSTVGNVLRHYPLIAYVVLWYTLVYANPYLTEEAGPGLYRRSWVSDPEPRKSQKPKHGAESWV